MTDDEKQRIREAKAAVTVRLAGKQLGQYRIGAVDSRLKAYVYDVAHNPTEHNLWEQLAVERFLGMLDRYGIDRRKVRMFYRFYEALKFPGVRGMQSYKLTPVQCFQFASIFGFWRDGKRIVREACLYVPRKFSKTTSTAALAVWDLLYGDSNAECYTGANSSDQAKKCFDVIRGCIQSLDPDGRHYQVNMQQVRPIRRDRQAFAQCLTANARTKDGLNASTVIMDEFSQARDSTLLNVLTTSMGARLNPLTVIITTASEQFDGPFYQMLQGYKSLLLGDVEDDHTFAHLFEPDLDDNEGDPKTWRKVQPHMGVTVSRDFYEIEWKKAQRAGGEAMLAFRTKLLNVYAKDDRQDWISAAKARDMMVKMDLWGVTDRPRAMVAIDLSERDDFSAVTIGIYRPRPSRYYFHTSYFFPREALPGYANEELYRRWVEEGWLTLTDGPVINYAQIVDYIVKLAGVYTILGIGYDPAKSLEMVNMLKAMGNPEMVKGVSQSYYSFTSAVQSFEHGAYTGSIFINDNPINAYCFGNSYKDVDRMENCKPMKKRAQDKIDGVITMLMCLKMFNEVQQ